MSMTANGMWSAVRAIGERVGWRTRTLAALVAISLVLIFLTTSVQAAPAQITLRLSQAISPDTSRGKACELFAKRVGELTKGQVVVQVFHNAALGSEAQSLEGLQTGTIDIGSINIFANVVKAGTVLDLPFLWRDYDHWKKAVDGKPGQMIADTAPQIGLRILGYWIGGYREVYGSKSINSLGDFNGLKIRTQQTPAYIDLFKAFGAVPVPIAWPETYLALQQKTVDAAETTFTAMYDAKQYEVAKYGSITNHAVSSTAFIVSENRWKALPEDVRQALVTAEKEAREFQRQGFAQEDADVIKLLKEKGMIFSTPDKAPFIAIAKEKVYPKHVTDALQKSILEEALKIQ
jgi:TRAP-type transport system periplasmic protein